MMDCILKLQTKTNPSPFRLIFAGIFAIAMKKITNTYVKEDVRTPSPSSAAVMKTQGKVSDLGGTDSVSSIFKYIFRESHVCND